jgi:two-component sensor histidine kinase/CheY-like chemotaxis protein
VRWSLSAGQIIRDHKMRAVRFTGVDMDITERKQAEERQSMLVRELDHRARNLLAVVQSVLQLSKADTTADFIAAVGGRIKALSRAHTLLSASRWNGVDLRHIVEEEMAPFANLGTPQALVEGPPVSLFPATSQSLAMALHELATNAAKYGALSVPAGFVKISWSLEPRGLVLRWVETGGPPALPPSRRGFGTKVIVAGIEQQLGGSVNLGWQAEGLCAELVIPYAQIQAPAAAIELRKQIDGAHGLQHRLGGSGARLLLVEDEALIGAMLKELLLELGFGVVGPLGSLTQALAAAQSEDVSGAVLDVNLGGEAIYPVAEALSARDIPFVFVTGYSPAGIDRRFAAIPVIEKPVEPDALRQLLTRSGFRPSPPVGEPPAAAVIH